MHAPTLLGVSISVVSRSVREMARAESFSITRRKFKHKSLIKIHLINNFSFDFDLMDT